MQQLLANYKLVCDQLPTLQCTYIRPWLKTRMLHYLNLKNDE